MHHTIITVQVSYGWLGMLFRDLPVLRYPLPNSRLPVLANPQGSLCIVKSKELLQNKFEVVN